MWTIKKLLSENLKYIHFFMLSKIYFKNLMCFNAVYNVNQNFSLFSN